MDVVQGSHGPDEKRPDLGLWCRGLVERFDVNPADLVAGVKFVTAAGTDFSVSLATREEITNACALGHSPARRRCVGLDDVAVTAAWLRAQVQKSRQRRRRTVAISLRAAELIDAALRELIDVRTGARSSEGEPSRAP